jgi:uncharacterized protein (DUF433 family)
MDNHMTLPDFLIEDPDGFIHVTGHRIGLQHLVHYYNEGYSPEMLVCEYPTLSLAVIHKVIGYYLETQTEVDRYVGECQEGIDRQRAAARPGPSRAELRRRLDAMRTMESG